MVQEMAKQHLSFETQLNKRSKRNTLGKCMKLLLFFLRNEF